MISQLLDAMKLTHYFFEDNQSLTNLMVDLSFGSFNLHACLYKNKINQYTNYYIFFDREKKDLRAQDFVPQNHATNKKAYLAYYTQSMGMQPTESMKKVKLPEIDKIYEVTGIHPQTFYQYELMTLFSEIILYYDDSEMMGNLSISNFVQLTLNQIIERYNTFAHQKNETSQFQDLTKVKSRESTRSNQLKDLV